MAPVKNPFTPTFGAPPPLLVGRRELMDLFEDALAEGPGSPGFATVYTGGRGVGKTVMLNAAEDIARQEGYAVISETATPGFLDRITSVHLAALLPGAETKVTGVTTPVGGIQVEHPIQPVQSLRSMVEAVTLHTPVLITLDELQTESIDELRDLAVVLQHAVREHRPLAFCAAGLPHALDELLRDQGVTFLRRADRHVLGAVRVDGVGAAFQDVVRANGRDMSDDVAAVAAAATSGYPFLIQLIGYHSWRQRPDAHEISLDDVEAGVAAANRRVGRLVIEPALNDLSAVARTFLLHMAVDDGPSRMADIATRMGVDANYASQYRLRLIGAGLIESAGHGRVAFTIPHLREWLREHDDVGTR